MQGWIACVTGLRRGRREAGWRHRRRGRAARALYRLSSARQRGRRPRMRGGWIV